MKRFATILLGIMAMGMPLSVLQAQEEIGTIKARMGTRLSAIGTLKSSRLVGEGNKGFLVILKDSLTAEQKALVDQENADRGKVYQYIAAKTGSTPELVGQRRAAQIAVESAPGVVYQDSAGNWKTK